jgi:hypothetical protein
MCSYIGDTKREPFKEVISIWFDQNLTQGENWPKEEITGDEKPGDKIQNMTEEYRRIKKKKLEASARSR